MNSDLFQGFYLGNLLIEPLKGQVTDRAESRHLPPKAVEVLLCLARESGDLVTREDLLNTVWGPGHGSQEALSHAVSEIRHALDDHPDNPHYIQTLPRRGYRLAVHPVPIDENTASIVLGAGNGNQLSNVGLLENLKRRGVLETALAYLIVGWLLIQIADIVFSRLHLPDWTATFVTVFVIAGFPIAIVLAWFLEYRDGRAVVDNLSPIAFRRRRFGRTYISVIAGLTFASVLVFVYDRNFGLPVAAPPDVAPTNTSPTLPPVTKNSIAVLPFFNIDGSVDTQTFANGLVDDVITRLSRVPNLRVSSRGDSYTLAPNSASAQVRQRLRVAMYLEGSVQIADDQIRVTVQLIDSETGFHMVARTFNRLRKDFFDIRDEITELTVANVRVALPAGVQGALSLASEDPSLDAYILYRRGIETSRQPKSKETIASALDWFDAALDVDPEYAAAHAGKCSVYVEGYGAVDDSSYIALADSACATALALNPNLDIVHTALGDLYRSTGQWDRAEAEYKESLAMDPSNVEALTGLGRTYQRQNRPVEAEASLRKAVDIHPGNAAAYDTLGVFLFQTGQFSDAATQYEFSVALEPENMHSVSNLASAYMLQGKFELAAPVFQRAIAIEPTKNAWSNLGLMQYYLGDLGSAIDSLSSAVELQPNDHLARSNLGDALWIDGRKDEARSAFRAAEKMALRALEINPKDPLTLMDLAWIKTALTEHKEARELIDRSMELVPDDPYVHYINGLMLNRRGDTADAVAAFETAVELGYSTKMLAWDPNISNLKTDVRFNEIVNPSK